VAVVPLYSIGGQVPGRGLASAEVVAAFDPVMTAMRDFIGSQRQQARTFFCSRLHNRRVEQSRHAVRRLSAHQYLFFPRQVPETELQVLAMLVEQADDPLLLSDLGVADPSLAAAVQHTGGVT
jgi:hypothetical protein